jgi:nucleotide-binding universal stress UspA family protein
LKPLLLVPVDFTENAFNTYRYANNLAYHLDYSLHLIHVVSSMLTGEVISLPKEDEIRWKALERLKSFSRWHPNASEHRFFPVETTYDVIEGSIAPVIVDRADPTQCRFIVCGTRDKHDLLDKWLGTVSSEIAMTAKVPVLLVPPLARFSNLKNVIMACDNHANDEYILAQIAIISDWFESNLHFVHVKAGTNDDFEFVEEDILDTLRAYQKKVLKVQMTTVEGLDVVESIFEYATTHQADLLIYISERRNFLQKIIFKSMSRKAVLNTKIPTLIMQVA